MLPEIYKIKEGKITIAHAEKKLSIGLLELNPHQALDKHNRPVDENLLQIQGESVLTIFEDKGLEKKHLLKTGDSILIPANQYHIHANQTEQNSLTLWKFEGDIIAILENIKKTAQKI